MKSTWGQQRRQRGSVCGGGGSRPHRPHEESMRHPAQLGGLSVIPFNPHGMQGWVASHCRPGHQGPGILSVLSKITQRGWERAGFESSSF